jgi:hypothetical protein
MPGAHRQPLPAAKPGRKVPVRPERLRRRQAVHARGRDGQGLPREHHVQLELRGEPLLLLLLLLWVSDCSYEMGLAQEHHLQLELCGEPVIVVHSVSDALFI